MQYVMKFALIRKQIVIFSQHFEFASWEQVLWGIIWKPDYEGSTLYTAHFNLVLSQIDVYNILTNFLSQSLVRNCKQLAYWPKHH